MHNPAGYILNQTIPAKSLKDTNPSSSSFPSHPLKSAQKRFRLRPRFFQQGNGLISAGDIFIIDLQENITIEQLGIITYTSTP